MTVFWIIAALMIVAALFFLIPPLLQWQPAGTQATQNAASVSIYRQQLAELDQDLHSGVLGDSQYSESRSELLRRMLEDIPAQDRVVVTKPSRRGITIAGLLAMLLPIASISLYMLLGNSEALAPRPQVAEQHHAVTPEQIIAMVERLAERMKQNPDNTQGWIMLARSYSALERYSDAIIAYEKATQLVPGDAQLFADYADTLAMAQGRSLAGRPLDLIETALKLDVNNLKALSLAGTAAFERKNYDQAIAYWQRFEQRLPADSDQARSIKTSIAEARAAQGKEGVKNTQSVALAQASVSGTVELSTKLAGKIAPGDTLFIFARALNGPKMPLAIIRARAGDLPKTFTLDDSMAMAPTMKLSKFSEVIVGARISKSGNAASQSGDLQGFSVPVKLGNMQIRIVIDEVVP